MKLLFRTRKGFILPKAIAIVLILLLGAIYITAAFLQASQDEPVAGVSNQDFSEQRGNYLLMGTLRTPMRNPPADFFIQEPTIGDYIAQTRVFKGHTNESKLLWDEVTAVFEPLDVLFLLRVDGELAAQNVDGTTKEEAIIVVGGLLNNKCRQQAHHTPYKIETMLPYNGGQRRIEFEYCEI